MKKVLWVIPIILFFLAACGSVTPVASPSSTIPSTFTPIPSQTPSLTPSPLPTATQTPIYLKDLGNLGQILFSDKEGKTWLVNADGSDAHEYSISGNMSPDGQYMVNRKMDPGFYITNGQVFVLEIYSAGHLINEITVEMEGGVDTYLSELTWSPDNKNIAFFYQNDVYLVQPENSNITKLSNHNKQEFYCSHMQWSPSSQKITFHCGSNIDPELHGIYILTASTKQMNFIPVAYDSYSLAWTPDEEHLFFVGFCSIVGNESSYDKDTVYVVDSDGRNLVEYWGVRSNADLILSPDGKYIAFSGLDPYDHNGDEIFLIDNNNLSLLADNQSDTSKYKLILITDNRSNDSHPSWSPDSKYIVFSSDTGRSGLFVVSLYDKKERQLLDYGKDPTWLPNP